MTDPETRVSLLLRIRDPDDAQAWGEFAVLYRETIFRMARSQGLQSADAEDIVQEVMLRVASAIENFDTDPRRGQFRHWLRTIARRMAINAVVRGSRGRGTGGSGVIDVVDHDGFGSAVPLQYRRAAFRAAAAKVSRQVHDKTWSAFWQTAVEGRAVSEVARSCQQSVGWVHTSRSRVMARLRSQVEPLMIDTDDVELEPDDIDENCIVDSDLGDQRS